MNSTAYVESTAIELMPVFNQAVLSYEQSADLQKHVAQKLASFLPHIKQPDILEVGAGTGLLTSEILNKYPDLETFLVSDIFEHALEFNRAKHHNHPNITFDILDGEKASRKDFPLHKGFNLIASSMCVQWFTNTKAGIKNLRKLLKPGGMLYYSCTGPNNWHEWKQALNAVGVTPNIHSKEKKLPGVFHTEKIVMDYGSGLNFARTLKNTKCRKIAKGPQMELSQLSSALSAFDDIHPDGKVTWEILYGKVPANKEATLGKIINFQALNPLRRFFA